MVIATGSEVSLAAAAAEALDSEGVGVRVVSLPCWELFGAQDADYRDSVLPTGVPRVAVEAGATLGWERYVGMDPLSAWTVSGLPPPATSWLAASG